MIKITFAAFPNICRYADCNRPTPGHRGLSMSIAVRPSTLIEHVKLYGRAHQTRVNRVLHFVGIPMLGIASLGLLAKIPMTSHSYARWTPNIAWLCMIAAAVWYLWQDVRLGCLAMLIVLACYMVGCEIAELPLALLFVSGTVIHFIGHFVFEGKPPVSLTRPIGVLEAPAWLIMQLASSKD
ncbi:MAG: Mpo1-like protein [Gemmataceae bacterium]